LAVKRVVGLPGEDIDIRRGDIYADGQIVRKSLKQQRSMAVLVHDNRFRPSSQSVTPPRWRPQRQNTGWQTEADGFRYSYPIPRGSASADSPAAASGQQEAGLDWLAYHHRPCFAGSDGRDTGPVTDHYGYNQGLSRHLSEVTDLMLTCQVRMTGRGTFAVLANDAGETFQVHWNRHRGQAELWCGEQVAAQAKVPVSLGERWVRLELLVCDQQVQLALDGNARIAYTYTPKEVPPHPSPRPLALGAVGLTAEVADVCVWRDVYYTHPRKRSVDWSLEQPLAADEYLLLGDNSPLSLDARNAPEEGQASRSAFVGRILPQPRKGYHYPP
jgi:signal peptidase I